MGRRKSHHVRQRQGLPRRFLEKATPEAVAGAAPERASPSTPLVPALAPESAGRSIVADHLGLDLAVSTTDLDPGQWYAVRDLPAVSVSVIAPQFIDARFDSAAGAMVNPLDPVESVALVYLVAFDLERLNFHYVDGNASIRASIGRNGRPQLFPRSSPCPDRTGWQAPHLS